MNPMPPVELGIALVEPVVHGWDLAVATGRPAERLLAALGRAPHP